MSYNSHLDLFIPNKVPNSTKGLMRSYYEEDYNLVRDKFWTRLVLGF